MNRTVSRFLRHLLVTGVCSLAFIGGWAQAGYQTCGTEVVGDTLKSCPSGGIPMYHSGTPLSISNSMLDFGNVVANKDSAENTVTITNSSSYTLKFPSTVSVTGTAFSATSNCTTGGTGSLAAGASCNIVAKFTPGSIGTASGQISFVTSASSSKNVISLVGTGSAPPAVPQSLEVQCPSQLNSGASGNCTATASFSDGTSRTVAPTWTTSNISVAGISVSGVLTAKTVTTDTPVTVTAAYGENGVSKTASTMVSVKAAPTLSELSISGLDVLEAGKSTTYTAKAVYSDGTSKSASTVTWSVSGSGATMDNSGSLTADAKATAGTTVSVTAIYTEGSVTKTAKLVVTIKAAGTSSSTSSSSSSSTTGGDTPSACSGTGNNLSAISIVGNATKAPGDSLEVDYCLKNFNSATKFDVYIAVSLPTGAMLFLQSAGFFGIPSFVPFDGKTPPKAYLTNTLIPDKSGPVLQIPAMPMDLPSGTYTFHAIPVLTGKDVFNGFNWVGQLASTKMNFNY